MLPFSLLVASVNIAQLRVMATAYEAHGVASVSCVMFWGSLWHLTVGILPPALIVSYQERRERIHFLNSEEAAAARHKAQVT